MIEYIVHIHTNIPTNDDMKQQMHYPIPSNEMKRRGLPKQRFSQIRTKKSGISYRKYQKFFLTLREQVISILLLYP